MPLRESSTRELGPWGQPWGHPELHDQAEPLEEEAHCNSLSHDKGGRSFGDRTPVKTPGVNNYSDCLTKPQALKAFSTLTGGMMGG
jgi:hypothetical protein